MARIKQFIKCITAKVNENDMDFISNYLSEDQKGLLLGLQECDIKHSVNVARDIYNNRESISKEVDVDELIKIALLHDIGKAYEPLNPIRKSILVLLDHFSKGNLKRFENKYRGVYIYYNHAEKSYEKLKNHEYSEGFLEAVRYHHNKKISNDIINELRKYDDRN